MTNLCKKVTKTKKSNKKWKNVIKNEKKETKGEKSVKRS